MSNPNAYSFLRNALYLDAAASGVIAIALIAGSGLVAAITGLPVAFLTVIGIALVPFVALVLWTARQAPPADAAVKTVIALNVAWVIASVAVLLAQVFAPSALGYGFIIVQAVAVGLFAELQFIGLRRSRAALAA